MSNFISPKKKPSLKAAKNDFHDMLEEMKALFVKLFSDEEEWNKIQKVICERFRGMHMNTRAVVFERLQSFFKKMTLYFDIFAEGEEETSPLPFSSAKEDDIKVLVPDSTTKRWQMPKINPKQPSEECLSQLKMAREQIESTAETGVQALFTVVFFELLRVLSCLYPGLELSMIPSFKMEATIKRKKKPYGWVDWALGIGPVLSGFRNFPKGVSLLTVELKVLYAYFYYILIKSTKHTFVHDRVIYGCFIQTLKRKCSVSSLLIMTCKVVVCHTVY